MESNMVMPLRRINLSDPLLPIHMGILATFALVPLWWRFKPSPGPFDTHYATGFLIFWPMLWTILWWLLRRSPGFRELRRDRVRCLWALVLLLLVCWAFMSWSWAYTGTFRPQVTIGAALPFGVAALFALAVACAAPPLKRIILVLVIGMAFSALIAGWQVARQGPVDLGFLGEFNINPANSGVSIVQADGVRWLRPYGLLPHPNILAGYLSVGLLASSALVLSNQKLIHWIGITVFLFGLWMLLLTFSRAAWIAFAAGGFALLPLVWERLRARELRLTVGVFVVLVMMVGSLFVVIYRPYLAARTGEGDESTELRSISDRLVYTEMAYRAIGESPILGVGMGNFPWRASYYLSLTDYDLRGQPVHQIFLSAWADLGVVGFVLTALALLLGVEAALRAIRKDLSLTYRSHETISNTTARAILLCCVIALMVVGLLDHYPWTLLHFQTIWWGLLGAAAFPGNNNAAPQPENGVVQSS
jgi:hypothetical protein